jgi:hypothetical protein
LEEEMDDAATSEGIVVERSLLIPRLAVVVLLLLVMCTAASSGQTASEPSNSTVTFSVRATHVLGFEGAENNSTGTLSIQDRVLRFQRASKPVVQVTIVSVQDVFLGDESKQVGGLPMTLGKAAVPFGGGRVVSLFAHKKYDTLALEYVANDGGIHGAIFELSEGQGKLLRDQLAAMGAHVSHNDEVKHSNVEVPNESK